MINKKIGMAMLVGISFLTTGCKETTDQQQLQQTNTKMESVIPVTLKAHFNEYFKIGTAISRAQIMLELPEQLDVAREQFNTFTPENSMKWERIHPTLNEFDFVAADALVEFAQKNDQQLVGHTLVWHSQTPDWVFEDENGITLSREGLLKRMEAHINTVAGRYKGKIFAWDVVNEAFNEDGSLRESKWSQIIGDDFIDQAFMFANKAAPNAKLYYNDYNLFKPEKRAGVIALVKRLQSKNIQIDGVGMQAHYALDYPDLSQAEDSIVEFSETGVDVMITELDISVLPFPEGEAQGADISVDVALQQEYNPYAKGLPAEVNDQLAKRYQELFKILKKHSDKVGRVTFWGVSDASTWRNDWPMKGRTDYPLLIDRSLQVKDFVSTL